MRKQENSKDPISSSLAQTRLTEFHQDSRQRHRGRDRPRPLLCGCKITMTQIDRSATSSFPFAVATAQIQLPTFTEHEGLCSHLVIPPPPPQPPLSRECENFSNMEINDQEKTRRERRPLPRSNKGRRRRNTEKISPRITWEQCSVGCEEGSSPSGRRV